MERGSSKALAVDATTLIVPTQRTLKRALCVQTGVWMHCK
jgi:hypothetical protein